MAPSPVRLAVLATALFAAAVPSARAEMWLDIATISATSGVNTSRVCVGGGNGSDIACPTNAPFVNPVNGHLGIGTDDPSTTLHIRNNIASGHLNTYDEYQLIIYNGTTASTAYGIGIKPNHMVFNAGGGYSFDSYANVTRLYISGTTGNIGVRTSDPSASLHINENSDVGLSSTDAGLMIGPSNGNNIVMDGNEIMARNVGGASPLYLQAEGGVLSYNQGVRTGLVGINLGAPLVSLHVSGSAILTSWTSINTGASATAPLDVGGTIKATAFVGDGSLLTGLTSAPSDRISTSGVVSGGNLAMIVAGNGGTVSFTTGGVAGSAYLDTVGRFIGPGISATANMSSFTTIYASGRVGLGTIEPSATLHIANNSATGFLDNHSEYQIILWNNLTNGGSAYGLGVKSNHMVFNAGGGNGGYSFDRNGNTTLMYISGTSGNVGVGTTNPQAKLDVAGTVSATYVKVADTGDSCSTGNQGTIRFINGRASICTTR